MELCCWGGRRGTWYQLQLGVDAQNKGNIMTGIPEVANRINKFLFLFS